MAFDIPPAGSTPPNQPVHDPPARHGPLLAIFPVALGAAGLLVPTQFPWILDTVMGVVLLLVCLVGVAWTLHLLPTWWLTRRRPGMTWWATATAIVPLIILTVVFQPPARSLHRHSCTFGPFGLGWGTVWIKIEPLEGQRPTPYHLRVRWGPHEAQIDEVLSQTTYFTMKKLDFFSRVGADMLVEPRAYISCGSGAPPTDSVSVELTDVWGPRSHQ